MTATLEAPPPVAVAPAPLRVSLTTAEVAAARKWFGENVKVSPVIPPSLKGFEAAWPLTPEKILTWIKLGQEKEINELVNIWNQHVTLMENDPLRHGYEPECWADADKCVEETLLTCLFGGGGSSKSRFMARTGVRKMLKKPGAKVLWLHEAQQPSIIVQQAFVYDFIPGEYKRMKQRKSDRTTKINYSRGTGFLAGQHHLFVMPNGSMGVFGFYNQDIKVCESHGWDLVLADENLPLGWLKTLLYRLPRCNGKMIWGYSPIYGITPAIKEVVAGAQILKTLPDDDLLPPNKVHVAGCPPGHMPYLQKGIYCDSKIMYFFTRMNPWSGYQMQKKVAKEAKSTVEDIERRFYGWSRDTIGKQFPKFGAWNIVSKVPQELTRYVVMDPGPGKNAFIIWVGVDRYRRHWVYREWPDVPTYGEWAVASDNAKRFDGDPGPAQVPLGKGVRGYKEIMLKAEGNTWTGQAWDGTNAEKIFIRYGDPRAFADPAGVEEGEGSALFDRFREVQVPEDKSQPIGPSMDFMPAPGFHIERGIEMINDLLDKYNPQEPVTAQLNEPGLYIHEGCKSLIWAMHNWTWRDGEKGASKDPIDDLRYMATADLQYHDPKMKVSYGGGSY